MDKVVNYVNIQEVLSRCTRHPLLKKNVDLEAAIQYTADFIAKNGYPDMYMHREDEIDIHEHRGILPCDVIHVIQVMDMHNHRCMRSTTDTFGPTCHRDHLHVDSRWVFPEEDSFRMQGRVIITTFPEGKVKVAYTTIPVDSYGFPLLIDDSIYLRALELYIKLQVFTILFDLGDINANVLSNAQQDYAFQVAQLGDDMNTPSLSEMESLSRSWCQLIQKTTEFDNGFRHLGDREMIKRH